MAWPGFLMVSSQGRSLHAQSGCWDGRRQGWASLTLLELQNFFSPILKKTNQALKTSAPSTQTALPTTELTGLACLEPSGEKGETGLKLTNLTMLSWSSPSVPVHQVSCPACQLNGAHPLGPGHCALLGTTCPQTSPWAGESLHPGL